LPAVVRVELKPSVVAGPSWYQEAPVLVGTFNQITDAEDFGRIRSGGRNQNENQDENLDENLDENPDENLDENEDTNPH